MKKSGWIYYDGIAIKSDGIYLLYVVFSDLSW